MAAPYDTQPQPGRVVVSAAAAAAALQRDARTVRAMISNGELQGVRQAAGRRLRWYVYADQLEGRTNRRGGGHGRAERDRLIQENAQLRARAEAAEETARSLLGAQALLMDALRSYRSGSERAVAAGAAFEEVTRLQREAIADYQSSSNQFAEALSAVRDILAAQSTPDDARDLTSDRLGRNPLDLSDRKSREPQASSSGE